VGDCEKRMHVLHELMLSDVQVICGDCISRKMALSFCGMAEKKVCNNCFTIINASRLTKEPSRFYRNRPLVKQVNNNDIFIDFL